MGANSVILSPKLTLLIRVSSVFHPWLDFTSLCEPEYNAIMKAQTANPTLADVLDQHTAVGSLAYPEDDRIRCVACGHRCLIGPGKRGICKVRFNDGGQLRVPFGYVAGLQCDPVEKKPFFHVYPGSDALTFGMMGCDLHCSYCQNWVTSQALRDAAAEAPVRLVAPAQLVEVARREGARLVVSSYNEPLITAEWGVSVFREATAAGLACAFVSNGNATPEVLDFLRPWIVAYKVDLKSFDDAHYRSLGGMLANIVATIRMIHERGIWLEVVTLVIPGFNDSEAELREMARFLASVSRDIPWHVTAFHKDYRMTDPDATSPRTLMRAAELGIEAGLRYVYAGNLPGQVGPWENTRCPDCGETLIERYGYLIRAYRLTADGCCPRCRTALPGIWPGDVNAVRTGNDRAAYLKRLPRPVATTVSHTLPIVPEPDAQKSRARSKRGDESLAQARRPKEGADPMATAAHRPELSPQQSQCLVAAARALVRDSVAGQPTALPAGADLGDHVVAGVFVSLKRGKHLRSCCGMMGKPIPLLTALQEAAQRTVWDDLRFPPVSPTELDHLDMEVWLLHSPEPVQARGSQRADAVTIGKHGIQVVRGQQHGLFLPSVALENQWDNKRFLDQVCIKAGLHASSWQDDATALFTFEGEVLRCPLAEEDPASRASPARRPGVCRPDEVRAYAEFCAGNINALLQGATPNYFFLGAPDGNVNGVILTIQQAAHASATHFCQLSLRPGVPLQSTLFALCQNAAQMLARQPRTASQGGIEVRVAILHDPVLHGTAGDPDLAGIDPSQRAILVMERNKSAVVFDPAQQPADALAAAVSAARVTHPGRAPVISLDALGDGAVHLLDGAASGARSRRAAAGRRRLVLSGRCDGAGPHG